MSKPALTIADQIALLKARGLPIAPDGETRLMSLLINNNYYRLSGYWRYFQTAPHRGDNSFRQDATVQKIIDVQDFDAVLRSILLEGLGVVEVTLRSRLAYYWATSRDVYDYIDKGTYADDLDSRSGREFRTELITEIRRDLDRSREDFIKSHLDRGLAIPIWVAVEAISMGGISKMYRLLDDQDLRYQVSKSFGLPTPDFAESVFRSFTVLRNACAHQGRIWNRTSVYPLQVLNVLKTDSDRHIYHRTPWAWLVMLAHTVDAIKKDDRFSRELWAHVDNFPEFKEGLTRPHRR